MLASADLLHPDDPIPEGWGVLAAHGRGLRTVRPAALRTPVAREPRVLAALLQASLRSHGSCRRLVLVGMVPAERLLAVEAENRELRWRLLAKGHPKIAPDVR